MVGYQVRNLTSFQASDTHSTGKVMVAIVKNCFEAKNWDALNEHIVLLTKKRGQIKQVSGFLNVFVHGFWVKCVVNVTDVIVQLPEWPVEARELRPVFWQEQKLNA